MHVREAERAVVGDVERLEDLCEGAGDARCEVGEGAGEEGGGAGAEWGGWVLRVRVGVVGTTGVGVVGVGVGDGEEGAGRCGRRALGFTG